MLALLPMASTRCFDSSNMYPITTAIIIINTNTIAENINPPFIKAYGKDNVPAPIQVVSKANTDEKNVPRGVFVDSRELRFTGVIMTLWTSGNDSKLVDSFNSASVSIVVLRGLILSSPKVFRHEVSQNHNQ